MLEEARPFIKWAGGKRQLLDELLSGLPDFGNYHEPFLGGGALFFKLEAMGRVRAAYLSDSNEELINAYSAIKNNVFEVINELCSGKYVNEREAFYRIRAEMPKISVQRAARFIYLNKTAYNGLYRVNSRGEFNAPFGRYEKPKICDEGNLLRVQEALQKDALYCGDFGVVLNNAKRGDLVYFDPPYAPLSKTANFTGYTKESFGEEEQGRLLEAYKALDKRGCYVLLSNSYTEFTAQLYGEFEQEIVHASRAINCQGDKRGKVRELIVRNWECEEERKKIVQQAVSVA